MGDHARSCAVERLKEAAAAGAPISALVATTAAGLGVSRQTVWRWLGLPDRSPPLSRRARTPSKDDIDAYPSWHGDASQAWAERRRSDAELPSLRTFQLDRGYPEGQ